MHCGGLRRLQVSSIMQHWALLVSIKDSILCRVSGINLLYISSHHTQILRLYSHCIRTAAWLIFSTKILSCKLHHVRFHFTLSPQERVTSTAGTQMFNFCFLRFEGENVAHSILFFQMWDCSDFNKQASN